VISSSGPRTSPALAGFFVAVAIWLTGCATPQVGQLAQQWPSDLSQLALLTSVPFFPQEDHECGPAALAMVLRSAGLPVEPEQLVSQVYVPGRQGTLQTELLVSARRHGLPAYVLQPEVAAVLREVAAGHPVLVFQNLGLAALPVWHYAVVIGYDSARNQLVLHSGRTAQLTMSLFTFERTWARGDHWAMVALPVEQVPVTAQADGYAQAVAALERLHAAPARTAYAAALRQWPTHRVLLLGAGNTAYALGDRAAAGAAYAQAVQAHPDFADAWNNLAQVQWEQGALQDAAASVARAVALGGPRLADYQALQQTIAVSQNNAQKGLKPPQDVRK
jgi:tetratricopeptide (TPR) repeat protein